MNNFLRYVLGTLMASCLSANVGAADVAAPSAHAGALYAEVDGEAISMQEFQSAFDAGVRQRFYHGKIPQEQLKAFRSEVSQSLVDRVLLVKEANRRQVQPDANRVNEQLQQYERRYQKTAHWEENKKEILAGLRRAIEEEEMIKRLKSDVQKVAVITDQQVRQFYQKRNDLFTTPEQVRVSVIMLKVAPSSGTPAWTAAQDEAKHLVQKLKSGASFSQLARIHSGDESSAKGGDMGYLHKGMLAPIAEAAIETTQVGEVTEPVLLLQGVAIFRVDERKPAVLNPFESVAERARALLTREMAETAWVDLLVSLRAKANIKFHLAGI